ncbi:sigma-54 dependent transcriptional regulator [uncultured Bacteroides sp.]|uniref:sigma-54-dependent transcriptional regulator n=1 Tax=uncultured Bacteroides sp. TaxID=162156 RepID=UPI00272CC521|nr:sigma 54-interacting transcriptional regulator [uncultured Bacteroides sp.]
MNKVLIVEASESDRRLMSGLLMRAGYEPIAVDKMEAAKDEVEKLPPGAVIVADHRLPDGSAKELAYWQKGEGFSFPVIAIVNNLNGSDLLEVMSDGGAVNVIQRAAIDKQLVETVGKYAKPENIVLQLDNTLIQRSSKAFRKIEQSIERVAATNANCIIFGESGMGKEQIARKIYLQSNRTQKPLIVLEAGGAALVGRHDPESDRSEMLNRIEGYFQEAKGGTLVIKNVQLLTFEKQSVLLHILEQEHPDVRIICTANSSLLKMVADETFRDNLFFILRQTSISVPPLRETTEDIPDIAAYLLTRYAQKKRQLKKRLDASALKALKIYPFPGNVRELKDVILFAAFHTPNDAISESDLSFSQSEPETDSGFKLQDPAMEKAKITAALEQAEGNKTMAAKLLKIDRSTLYIKMRQYGLK